MQTMHTAGPLQLPSCTYDCFQDYLQNWVLPMLYTPWAGLVSKLSTAHVIYPMDRSSSQKLSTAHVLYPMDMSLSQTDTAQVIYSMDMS